MTYIQISTDNAVGYLTINRPHRFNSLDVETARDLRKAGLQLARDESVRCVVLRGIDGIFCSGADLKYIRAGGDSANMSYLAPRDVPHGYGEVFKQILEYIHSTISEIRRAPKPWIAAVDGIAAAGGFGLAMSCDLVLASERATFEWAYAKTGLTGAESSTFFLPKLVGLRRAFELVMLNPRLDAKAALDLGLITRVFPVASFVEEVDTIARELAHGPTEALAIAKSLINQSAGIDRLDYHLDRELENLAKIANGQNFEEGISAFFEKRTPEFSTK